MLWIYNPAHHTNLTPALNQTSLPPSQVTAVHEKITNLGVRPGTGIVTPLHLAATYLPIRLIHENLAFQPPTKRHAF